MQSLSVGLVAGLAFAIFDLSADCGEFQSWLDPFIIISALPALWRGSCGSCSSTHTTISVPALTGSIMCMGVATAEQHPCGELWKSGSRKEWIRYTSGEAGFTRFRL